MFWGLESEKWKVSHSVIWLFVTPWTVAHKAPLSKEFFRQEFRSGWPFLSPGDLPNPGMKLRSPTLQADSTDWATREASGAPRATVTAQNPIGNQRWLELESVSTCSSLGEQQRKRGWNVNEGKANCTFYCTLEIHRFISQLCFKKAGENYICIYIQEKQSFYKENVNSHTLPWWVSPDWGLPVGCAGQQAADWATLTWRGKGKVPFPCWLPDLSFGGVGAALIEVGTD